MLVLAPAKREDLDTEIGLAFFHDVIREPELKVLKDLAGNKVRELELVIYITIMIHTYRYRRQLQNIKSVLYMIHS